MFILLHQQILFIFLLPPDAKLVKNAFVPAYHLSIIICNFSSFVALCYLTAMRLSQAEFITLL